MPDVSSFCNRNSIWEVDRVICCKKPHDNHEKIPQFYGMRRESKRFSSFRYLFCTKLLHVLWECFWFLGFKSNSTMGSTIFCLRNGKFSNVPFCSIEYVHTLHTFKGMMIYRKALRVLLLPKIFKLRWDIILISKYSKVCL